MKLNDIYRRMREAYRESAALIYRYNTYANRL